MLLPQGGSYSGQWLNNLKEGKGIFTWQDGDQYDGDWAQNKRNGDGIYKWANGNQYVGEWKDDKRSGKGKKNYQLKPNKSTKILLIYFAKYNNY